jgi:hypothetical protein
MMVTRDWVSFLYMMVTPGEYVLFLYTMVTAGDYVSFLYMMVILVATFGQYHQCKC